jgi:hypothetical protein
VKNWGNIQWIFEEDGALRDIYVQNATISDWKKIVDLLNSEYKLTFGVDQENMEPKIDFEFVKTMFADETGELETKSATIDVNGITTKCYFFLEDQIEFDINPIDIKSESELNVILDFMKSVSNKLERQVTLCGENTPEFPLIKIDVINGIERTLTEKEAENLWKSNGLKVSGFTKLKLKIIMKYVPKRFEKNLLKSAKGLYTSISKEKNVW